MFRPIFLAVWMTTISCVVATAAPKWTAPGLVKSLREADRVVERADIPPAAFVSGGAGLTGRKQEVIDGLNHSALCAEPHTVSIAVVSITDSPDGGAQIVGTWSRDSKGRVFYSPGELTAIADWKRQWDMNHATYADRLVRYNERRRSNGATDLEDPARGRELEIRNFNAQRDNALAGAHTAAKERERIYTQVRIELNCPAELAAKIDRPKLLRARQVPALIHPRACDLDLPDPAVSVPPVISRIRADLVDIDTAVLKKEAAKKAGD